MELELKYNFFQHGNNTGQLSLAIPPWVGAVSEYQRKLGRKQAHRAMH